MTLAMRVLCRVIRRRIEQGETLDKLLLDYPRLTDKARAELLKALAV